MEKFRKERLPDAATYYSARLEKLKYGKNKATACCPFHDDKHPSFEINLENGAFRCYSCGDNGRGIIDFQMQFYGQDFKSAAKALGAWG